MVIPKAFSKELRWMAHSLREQDYALQQEEEKTRKQLNKIEEKRANFAQVDTRLNTYPPIKTEHPCPRCWLFDGIARETHPISSDDSNNDVFLCSHCKYEIVCKL